MDPAKITLTVKNSRGFFLAGVLSEQPKRLDAWHKGVTLKS